MDFLFRRLANDKGTKKDINIHYNYFCCTVNRCVGLSTYCTCELAMPAW